MDCLPFTLLIIIYIGVLVKSEGEEACETLPSEIHITKGMFSEVIW